MTLIKLAVLLVIVGNVLCDSSITDNDVSRTRKGKCKKLRELDVLPYSNS